MLLVKDKFLVKDTRHGMTNLIFTYEDPKKIGCTLDVDEGVSLDYDMDAVHSWPEGADAPEVCVGQDPDDPKHYKVFKYEKDCQREGYRLIPGTPLVFGSWRAYRKLSLVPPDPDPERTPDDLWYGYLDKLDIDSRSRRQHAQVLAPPMGGSRDEVAAWVAKRHLIVDSSIKEISYLPHDAPAEEIRFLEVSDRLGDSGVIEAMDFGLNVEDGNFHLYVADITSDQLEQIKQDASLLPAGWSLKDSQIFRRREA